VLFVAENLTLAQVVRLRALAAQLDARDYEVHFACSEFEPIAFDGTHFARWPLVTVDRAEALRKVERGQRPYELEVLARYVEEELRLFESVKPDLVIGDFRLSLPVSTRVAGLRHAALINAYWSPYLVREGFPVPDHPIVQLLGAERASKYFPQALPIVFAHFAAPLNRLRKRYGLAPLKSFLELLTGADFTLYPDVPELCPTDGLPENHEFLGPVLWSPNVDFPAALGRSELPLVYVTLGSSGRVAALDAVLAAIAELPLVALIATAGRAEPGALPENARVVDYVPGQIAAARAAFVVTNGGSSTGYQALAEGKPVLGIASNMDQYLTMAAIERAGAGLLVRSGSAKSAEIRLAMLRLLEAPSFREGATRISQAFARFDCHQRFARFLERAIPRRVHHATAQ
jgi:UDP:flavonoid glycosyltransferase YjiC (YdhE family)